MTNLQLETNRANAQHSTGPRTPEGKERSRLNATRHGLTGEFVLLHHEDHDAYAAHVEEMTAEWQPQGPTERHLAQTLADCQWRLSRAHARQYPTLSRASYDTGEQKEQIEISKEFDRITRYTSRIQREYHAILKDLQMLQAQRKAREQAALEQAARLQKFFAMKGEAFTPAEFGFVLTAAEIEDYTRSAEQRQHSEAAELAGFNIEKCRKALAAVQAAA